MSWVGGSKFKNRRATLHGQNFASQFEAQVFALLQLLEKQGEISKLTCQPKVYLTRAKILYKPDFSAIDAKTGKTIFIEAKGMETPTYKIKKRLWRYYGPGVLHVYKRRKGYPTCVETVEGEEIKKE